MPRAPKKSSISPRVATLRDLRSYAKSYGTTQAARWAGLPVSTLNGWLDRRSLSPRSVERAQASLKSLSKEEKGYKRDVRNLSKEFRDLEKLNNFPQFAKQSNRQTRTVERWRDELKQSPNPALVNRIKAGFSRADNAATLIDSKPNVRRNKKGDPVKTVGRTETWDAIRPPKNADRYRIVGVDKDGNVTWSTLSGDDYDDVIEDADDVSDKYNTTAVYIILTYLN
mgnify:CR=1 FL=1